MFHFQTEDYLLDQLIHNNSNFFNICKKKRKQKH